MDRSAESAIKGPNRPFYDDKIGFSLLEDDTCLLSLHVDHSPEQLRRALNGSQPISVSELAGLLGSETAPRVDMSSNIDPRGIFVGPECLLTTGQSDEHCLRRM